MDLQPMPGTLTPGATLGTYRIERLLGRGGTGAVFLAHDTRLERPVALKVLDSRADHRTSSALLLREARNAAALNHPHICAVHEVGSAGGAAFIAMEFVNGRSLRDRIATEGAMPLAEALRLGIQAAAALGYAHEKGVVHRDFKAGNVILGEDGRLKIVDFGLARRDDLSTAGATTLPSLVPAGHAAGTPYAMAPEQVRGEPADARSDVWALGVLLQEMASGAAPFAGGSTPEVFASILTQAPAPLPSSVPASLRVVIERCLEKEPERRYQTARDVRVALEAVQAGTVPRWVAWRSQLRRHCAAAAAAALVAAVAVGLALNPGGIRDGGGGPPPAPPRIKLMVLPFENLTGDPDQEYFSDGLTDEMITQLGRLHPARLRVIARSSAMQYKGRGATLDEIGRTLGVDYVLEGSARREGSRVRVNATLVQLSGLTPRWTESFDRELSGILTLQSDLARGVARALALTLLPAEQARLAGASPVNPEAYELYLRGQSHARRLTRGDLDRALEYYERAVTADPDFALAHFGIGGVWAGRQQMGFIPPGQARGPGGAALTRALALDPTLPEGHLGLANGYTWGDWNWAAAEPSFLRAIDLNPSYAEARAFYAHFLYIMHRPAEASVQMQAALELDPLNELIQQLYGMTLSWEHRFEDAIAHAQNVLTTHPNSPSAWNALYTSNWALGRYEDALAAGQQAFGARGDPTVSNALTAGYADSGPAGAARRVADVIAARGGARVAAEHYMRAGEHELALDWLERARDNGMPYISVAAIWDGVRGHPRFQALLERMKLPPYARP